MKRARVLLADDHPDIAEQLRSILDAEFDVVGIVGDGSTLIDASHCLEPDVIVTDLAMPGMDGLEATTAILQRTPNARVVVITSQHEVGIERRALAAGALGYLTKFTADDDLVPAVHAAFRGERFVRGPHERKI